MPSLVSEYLDGQIGRTVHDERLGGEILRNGHISRHADDSLHALQIAQGRFRLRDGVQKTERGAFLSLLDGDIERNLSLVNHRPGLDGNLARHEHQGPGDDIRHIRPDGRGRIGQFNTQFIHSIGNAHFGSPLVEMALIFSNSSGVFAFRNEAPSGSHALQAVSSTRLTRTRP